MDNLTHFVVMDKTAKMPASARHAYRRVAVVETDLPEGQEPKFIGPAAIGLIRIVKTWEKLHAGKTEKSVYFQALAEARELAAALNTRNKRLARRRARRAELRRAA